MFQRYYKEVKEMNLSFAKLGSEECEACVVYDLHLKENECTQLQSETEGCDTCLNDRTHKEKAKVSSLLSQLYFISQLFLRIPTTTNLYDRDGRR